MPTVKSRIHITPSDTLYTAIEQIAKRDNVRLASKVTELLQQAIEIEEDEVLHRIAQERDKNNVSFVSHQDVWG